MVAHRSRVTRKYKTILAAFASVAVLLASMIVALAGAPIQDAQVTATARVAAANAQATVDMRTAIPAATQTVAAQATTTSVPGGATWTSGVASAGVPYQVINLGGERGIGTLVVTAPAATWLMVCFTDPGVASQPSPADCNGWDFLASGNYASPTSYIFNRVTHWLYLAYGQGSAVATGLTIDGEAVQQAGGATATPVPPTNTPATPVAPTTTPAPSACPSTATCATLTFSDEFNGSAVDASKWGQTCDGGSKEGASYCGGEKQYFTPTANGESGGLLTITAAPANTANDAAPNYAHPYTSGMLLTRGGDGWTQTYGYWEVRAKLAPGQGMWNAFWEIPANGGPPEIDNIENYGVGNTTGYYTAHWPGCSPNPAGCQDSQSAALGFDPSAGFHTYSIDWRANHLNWYVDHALVRSVTATGEIPQTAMQPVIQLAVGSSWNGNEPTGETAQMQVDYIRVYG